MALCCCRVCMLPASKKHRKKWKKKIKWNRSREHTGSLFPNLPSHNTTTHFSGTGLAASEIYHLPKTPPPKKQQQFIGTGLPVIVLPPLQGQVLSSKTPFNTSELCLLLHLVLTIPQMHYHFLWGSVVRIGVIVLGSAGFGGYHYRRQFSSNDSFKSANPSKTAHHYLCLFQKSAQ